MLPLQRRLRAAPSLHFASGRLVQFTARSLYNTMAPSAAATDATEPLVRAPPGALRCQKDSSLRSLASRVLAVEEVGVKATKKTREERYLEVELYDTVLFPEGGGQPWDTGKINDAVVDKVYNKDGRCIHRVPLVSRDGAPLPAFETEQSVVTTVDWERRFDHMQQHSGQHLLSAIAETRYGFDTASWRLGEERCNVDLIHLPGSETAKLGHKVMSPELTLRIQEEANAAILEALSMTPIFAVPGTPEWDEVAAKFSADDMPEVMRIMNIQGVENNPCCGVHVQNLAQLQSVRILSVESAGAGVTRVWFVAGGRVNREFARMLEREQTLTKVLECGPEKHAERAEKLLQAHKATLKDVKTLQAKLAASIAADLLAQSQQKSGADATSMPVVYYQSPDGDLPFLQAILKQLGAAKETSVFVMAAGGSFLLAGPDKFIMQHTRDAVQVIDGKGGGGKFGIFQGKAADLSEAKVQALAAKLEELQLEEESQ